MKKYIVSAICDFKLSFKYRLNLFLDSTMLILPLLGYTFLWKNIYSGGAVLQNYSLPQLFTYYFWALICYNTMPVYAYSNITHNIKEGTLTFFLTRPFNFLIYYYSIISGAAIIWLATNLIVVFPFLIIFKSIFIIPDFLSILFGIIFFLLGFILSILAGFILNLTAFFVGDPYGYRELYGWVLALLGGSIIPLDILHPIFLHLPFKFFYYIPAKAFMGNISHIPFLLFEEVCWISCFFLIVYVMWRFGLKKYEGFGG